MAQSQVQIQKQEQVATQTQTYSQRQLLQSQLVELPVGLLIDRINTEMNDNPALENVFQDNGQEEHGTELSDDVKDDFDTKNENEERMTALDEALCNIGRDDEDLPVYRSGSSYYEQESEERVYGQCISFYDQLKEQMGEISLTERQADIMDYLIGSLDNDGWLRKSNDIIADEMALYQNVYVEEREIEEVVRLLQEFDPAGIGARSLQECMLLQIKRRDDSRLKMLMEEVVNNFFDEFTKKHWDRIADELHLNRAQTIALNNELCKLNPKPGAAMGEVSGRSIDQITPDFIVDTQEDGTVTFALNNTDVPELHISPSFLETLEEYKNHKEMSRQLKEALLFTKKKVSAARMFIDAVKVRQQTLMATMKAIIQWQHRFFEEGDETALRPMVLRDIAQMTGISESTVSRVSKSKYVQTRWGIFPLRHFFIDSFMSKDGEELSKRKVQLALQELINEEDKHNPLSDDMLKMMLEERGFPIARRTVGKYREQLGLPIARLRKII